jgi:hypothetical protein
MRSDKFLYFRDPWGNRIEVVERENIQFIHPTTATLQLRRRS